MDYDQIKEKALAMYGSEEKADAFMEGFAKEAALWDYTLPGKDDTKTLGTNILDNMSGQLGKGIGNVLLNTAVTGAGKVVSGVKGMNAYKDFLVALNKAIEINKVLKGADRNKVLAYGQTVFKFAPHVALDANMLASILANAVHGEGIDPMTIRTLSELEAKYQDNTQFLPKNFN